MPVLGRRPGAASGLRRPCGGGHAVTTLHFGHARVGWIHAAATLRRAAAAVLACLAQRGAAQRGAAPALILQRSTATPTPACFTHCPSGHSRAGGEGASTDPRPCGSGDRWSRRRRKRRPGSVAAARRWRATIRQRPQHDPHAGARRRIRHRCGEGGACAGAPWHVAHAARACTPVCCLHVSMRREDGYSIGQATGCCAHCCCRTAGRQNRRPR